MWLRCSSIRGLVSEFKYNITLIKMYSKWQPCVKRVTIITPHCPIDKFVRNMQSRHVILLFATALYLLCARHSK